MNRYLAATAHLSSISTPIAALLERDMAAGREALWMLNDGGVIRLVLGSDSYLARCAVFRLAVLALGTEADAQVEVELVVAAKAPSKPSRAIEAVSPDSNYVG